MSNSSEQLVVEAKRVINDEQQQRTTSSRGQKSYEIEYEHDARTYCSHITLCAHHPTSSQAPARTFWTFSPLKKQKAF
jgi:hypothetical protein